MLVLQIRSQINWGLWISEEDEVEANEEEQERERLSGQLFFFDPLFWYCPFIHRCLPAAAVVHLLGS